MKKVTKILALVMVLFATQSFAQTKLGHINMQELINLMPERDSAVVKLENYAKELDETTMKNVWCGSSFNSFSSLSASSVAISSGVFSSCCSCAKMVAEKDNRSSVNIVLRCMHCFIVVYCLKKYYF